MATPDKRWSQWAAPQYQGKVREAEDQLLSGDIDAAKLALQALAGVGEPAAQTLLSQISHQSEARESFEDRQRQSVEDAARQGFPPALYLLGFYYDEGELGYPVDKNRAAELFRAAAKKGHVQSQWIHGLDLLNGTNGIRKDLRLGREYLQRAYDAGLQRALETVADFHQRGVFGFEKNETLAAQIAARATDAENWI